MNNEKKNKLKMRDIITLSIFNVAMIIIMLVTKMCTMMLTTPAFDYLFYVGIMGLLCAPVFVVMSNKVAKRGTYLITGIFGGLFITVMGSPWFLPVMIVVGIVCEIIMIGQDTYRNPKRNGIAYSVYWALYALGSAIPMFFFKEQYLNSLKESYTEEGIKTLVRFYGSWDMLLLIAVITIVLSAIGFIVGKKLMKKHIEKAKLV
jgi:hypothetical protein